MGISRALRPAKAAALLVLAVACVCGCLLLSGCNKGEGKNDAELVSYEDPTGSWTTMYSSNFSVTDEKEGSMFTVTNPDGSVTYGTITVKLIADGNAQDWLVGVRQDALDGKYGKIAEDTSVSDIESVSLEGHDCSSVSVVIDDGAEGTGYYFIGDNCDGGLMTYVLCFTQSGFDGVSREFTNLITNMELK